MAAHNPTSSKNLEDQAAAAALYVTEPHKQTRDYRKEANYPLDANGKLTSAGAAASLKRAEAKDLPSFPSVGIAQTGSAAGGAANLAVQNTKSPEWWKPEASAGASKAALMANDYKMKPLWQPEASAAGSKAALLAHQKGAGLDLWEPTASDKALMAAAGAAAGQKGGPVGRKAPANETGLADRYPDERNAAKNALSAATMVHTANARKYNDLPGYTDEEAEKIRQQATVKGMDSSLFGSTPLIGPELQERQRQAGLHAAAVSMAQGMYGKRDQAYRDKVAAARTSSRNATGRSLDGDSDDEETPMSFMGLQEAAQKLANERLAKLQDPNAAYREHYGTQSAAPKSRLSMLGGGSLRRKDSDEDMNDERRSHKIRGEMNLFQDKLKEIDDRKRKDDRAALLAAAQKNVKALSAEIDEDVFQKTGKMSPAMRAEWEAKARARAQAASEARTSNYGKVNIGGGKYMDQTEVDAIAQGRLQPTLDAISAKAAHDREVDEQNRLAEEERRRIEQEAKEQERYQNTMVKEEWKKFKAEEKAEEKARKQEEKEAKKDEKMQEKFEHQKEHEVEEEAKIAEKEHDKEIQEEWKAFKQHEREEAEAEKARKEDNRKSMGDRIGSIFGRKSKKEKDVHEPEDKRVSTVVPAGEATTTTTITSGEPVPKRESVARSSTPNRESVAASSIANRDSVHHEEPHHNPLMPVENTPEAKAANQQKPGGGLLSRLRNKKEQQEEDKQSKRLSKASGNKHSTAEATAVGAGTGALAGAVASQDSALEGKDEPGKAQPSTGVPAPEAVAPEHAEKDSAPAVSAAPAESTTPANATTTSAPETSTAAAASQPGGLMYDPLTTASRATADSSEDTSKLDEKVVPASTTGATMTDSNVDRAEKPAVHDAGQSAVVVPAVIPAQEPVARDIAPETSSVPAVAPIEQPSTHNVAHEPAPAPVVVPVVAPVEQPEAREVTQEAAPAPTVVADKKVESHQETPKPATVSAPAPVDQPKTIQRDPPAVEDKPVQQQTSTAIQTETPRTAADVPTSSLGPQSAGPVAVGSDEVEEPIIAMGSDKPVTSEIRHSKIVDTLDPRANVGKPGFTGSEKFAAATADMRGTDHAGADATIGAATGSAVGSTAAATQPEKPKASHDSVAKGAEATHKGGKVDAPVADRIAVPAEAAAAADETDDKGGKHGTPREAEQKKQSRLSGFLKNKLGIKVKEHKGSDGVTVTPTTQYTTMGKYVDPNDKHSTVTAAAVPANASVLENAESSSSAAQKSTAEAGPSTAKDIDTEASGIAVDPAFQSQSTASRGRTTGGSGEDTEEGRDTVAGLPLPKIPGLPRASESPARETRFKEELNN